MITNSEKVSMEISRILDTTREMPCQKVNIGVSKILIFPWAIRYDVIRYIDIEPIDIDDVEPSLFVTTLTVSFIETV